jgi:hypothetical protein
VVKARKTAAIILVPVKFSGEQTWCFMKTKAKKRICPKMKKKVGAGKQGKTG